MGKKRQPKYPGDKPAKKPAKPTKKAGKPPGKPAKPAKPTKEATEPAKPAEATPEAYAPTFYDVETGTRVSVRDTPPDPVERVADVFKARAAAMAAPDSAPDPTREKKGRGVWKPGFLALLALSGSPLVAAAGMGIDSHTASRARKADPEFDAAARRAIAAAGDRLEVEARRRAMDGTLEPVFFEGGMCGVVRKYSDKLLIKLLEGAKPNKYRQRKEVTHKREPEPKQGRGQAMYAELLARIGAGKPPAGPSAIDTN